MEWMHGVKEAIESMNLFKQLFGSSAVSVSAVNPREARELLKGKQPPFLLDVRQPAEYHAGHIAGASLIPLSELRVRTDELPQDREILCVCRSGSRSGAAARQLAAAGFKTLNLAGGMSAWQHAGLPIKKGTAR
jgi:phage shock protein E